MLLLPIWSAKEKKSMTEMGWSLWGPPPQGTQCSCTTCTVYIYTPVGDPLWDSAGSALKSGLSRLTAAKFYVTLKDQQLSVVLPHKVDMAVVPCWPVQRETALSTGTGASSTCPWRLQTGLSVIKASRWSVSLPAYTTTNHTTATYHLLVLQHLTLIS